MLESLCLQPARDEFDPILRKVQDIQNSRMQLSSLPGE